MWNKTGSFIAFVEHIALVTPGFANGEQDTACIPALQHFARALLEKNIQVTIFALHYPFRSDPFLWHSARVYPLNGANSRWKRTFTLEKKLLKSFRKAHDETPFSRIHACWLNEATIWSVALGKHFSLPVSATAMGQDVLASNAYIKKNALRKLSTIVTLSQAHAAELYRTTSLSSEIIPWGVPISPVFQKERTIDLIGVGNLIPLKNYDYFLRICAALKTIRPDFTAFIVGSGPEEKRLQQEINRLQLQTQVQLVGSKNYEQTQELIRSASVLVHPSTFESFGMVVIEALAAGTSVFARKTGIAASDPNVFHLTNNAVLDAENIAKSLVKSSFDSSTYTIAATVNSYLEKVFNNKRTDV